MVSYKVSASEEAKQSLQQIYNWLKMEVSLLTAQKVRDGILDEIAALADMPHRHAIEKAIQHNEIVYRRILKWSYRIIFTIDEELVEVLVVDIVHTKRDPKKLQDQFGD